MEPRSEVHAVRLESGALLPSAVERICAELDIAFCAVTGFGQLDWVELAGPRGGDSVRLEGPFTLLGLQGRLRRAGGVSITDLVCTLSRWTDSGLQVLGGVIVGARAAHLELAFERLSVVDPPPAELQVSPSNEVVAAPKPPPLASPAAKQEPGGMGARWAQAIAESRRMEKEGRAANWDESEVVLPARGDVVNHLHFGKCGVAKIDDEHISLKKPDGRVVQLGLTILEFKKVGTTSGGKSEYDVKVRKG